jgi:hypothetical protein
MITQSLPRFSVYRLTYHYRNGRQEERHYVFCGPSFGSGTIRNKHQHIPIEKTDITLLGQVEAMSPEVAIQIYQTAELVKDIKF